MTASAVAAAIPFRTLQPPTPIVIFPWVVHSLPLHALIEKLTSESKAQLLVDVERLFHSCRLNKEVTKETLSQLQRAWDDTTSGDKVRVKVLLIVDRLLDRQIFSARDKNLKGLTLWLSFIENGLDTYRFPHCTKVLAVLTRKIASGDMHEIAPISHCDLTARFDAIDVLHEYRHMLQEGPVHTLST
jgi:hypothetical protein